MKIEKTNKKRATAIKEAAPIKKTENKTEPKQKENPVGKILTAIILIPVMIIKTVLMHLYNHRYLYMFLAISAALACSIYGTQKVVKAVSLTFAAIILLTIICNFGTFLFLCLASLLGYGIYMAL